MCHRVELHNNKPVIETYLSSYILIQNMILVYATQYLYEGLDAYRPRFCFCWFCVCICVCVWCV